MSSRPSTSVSPSLMKNKGGKKYLSFSKQKPQVQHEKIRERSFDMRFITERPRQVTTHKNIHVIVP